MTDDLDVSADAPKECEEQSHLARVVVFHPMTGEPEDRGVAKLCDYAVLAEDISAIPAVVTVKPEPGDDPEPIKSVEIRLSTVDEEARLYVLPRAAALALISLVSGALSLTERIDVTVLDERKTSVESRGYL